MKTIGIISGVAWPSSIIYYQKVNELIAARLGGNGLHSAKLVMAQTDFEEIERRQREGRWDLVGALLAEQGNKLKAAGADFFLIACNTVHSASEIVEANVDLPFIHIVDPTAKQIMERKLKTVGLLGSRYTMKGTYFVDRLKDRYGLNVLIAEGKHQENVHNALYEELAKGVFLSSTREKFKVAMDDLVQRGADVIVLGCTEFGMLVQPGDSSVPIIDTTIAHAEAAADAALT